MNKEVPIFETDDVERNRKMGALSIFSILFLIYLFSSEKSPYMRYCANKGLLFTILGVVLGFFYQIFINVQYFSEELANLVLISYGGLSLILFLYRIYHIVGAYNGNPRPIPFIGNIDIIK